jgi:hypothetical protein
MPVALAHVRNRCGPFGEETMLGTVVNLLIVVVIVAGLVQAVRDWQTGEWEHADWTSADRKLVRTMRIVMLGSVAVAWALALVAIIYRPDLIHEPRSNNVVTGPLLITAFALSGNNPTMLERLRRTWGIRNLMIGAAFVSLCLLGGAFFAVIDAWTPPGKW